MHISTYDLSNLHFDHNELYVDICLYKYIFIISLRQCFVCYVHLSLNISRLDNCYYIYYASQVYIRICLYILCEYLYIYKVVHGVAVVLHLGWCCNRDVSV